MRSLLEDNEMFNLVVKEFKISNSDLEQVKEPVKALIRVRMELLRLLKLPKVNIVNLNECLDESEKKIVANIKTNESVIKSCEKKQIELKDKIKLIKQEIKVIKPRIGELEDMIKNEQQEGRRLRETLRIFISREKFKSIKKILLSRYRKVFLKYSNELSIENKIIECNQRKVKIREEVQSLNNIIKGYTRKITTDRKALAEIKKNIISMEKSIEFFYIKLQGIKDYKEMEDKYRQQANQFSIIK